MGTPLSRRKLAAQFGMSSLPISEAIQRLENEGLVESRPRVGTRVRIPTPQDLRDLYIVREALESQSARLFAEKASSAERLELRGIAARLDEMMGSRSNGDLGAEAMYKTQAYHLSFHMRIAECTGSVALCDAIEKNHVLVFNWLFDITIEFRLPARWHQDLVDAIAGHDPEAADSAMRRHVRHGMEELQRVIASRFGPDFGRLMPSQAPISKALLLSTGESGWRSRGKRRSSSSRL